MSANCDDAKAMSDQSKQDEPILLGAVLRRGSWEFLWFAVWALCSLFIFKWAFDTEGIRHLRLMHSSATTSGKIIAVQENPGDDDSGGTHFTFDMEYSYEVNGRAYRGAQKEITGRAPNDLSQPITVEYLPNRPSVSRAQGTGPRHLISWFFYTFFAGSIPGIVTVIFACVYLKAFFKTMAPLMRLRIPQ